MELCDGGDLECYLRSLEPALLEIESSSQTARLAHHDAAGAQFAILSLFQMCFSLFAARDRLSLVHFDVKLLNWFIKTPPLGGQLFRYRISEVCVEVPMIPAADRIPTPTSVFAFTSLVVKLADYGTASTRGGCTHATAGFLSSCSSSSSPNDVGPLKKHHWTTIENAPPEFFLQGDAAVPSYNVDTWALGLCALHLLTGGGPYEETLEACCAPAAVRAALLSSWGDPTLPFSVIRKLIAMDPSLGDLVVDTIWRYAVLGRGYGISTVAHTPAPLTPTPLSILQSVINPVANVTNPENRTFLQHCALFSWECGTHPALLRARRRCAHLPAEFSQLVLPHRPGSLLSWSPLDRPTLRTAMTGGAFKGLYASPPSPVFSMHSPRLTLTFDAFQGHLGSDV